MNKLPFTLLLLSVFLIFPGDAIMLAEKMAMAQFPLLEKRYGYQPMRIGQGRPSNFFHGSYVLRRGEPINEKINGVIQR